MFVRMTREDIGRRRLMDKAHTTDFLAFDTTSFCLCILSGTFRKHPFEITLTPNSLVLCFKSIDLR